MGRKKEERINHLWWCDVAHISEYTSSFPLLSCPSPSPEMPCFQVLGMVGRDKGKRRLSDSLLFLHDFLLDRELFLIRKIQGMDEGKRRILERYGKEEDYVLTVQYNINSSASAPFFLFSSPSPSSEISPKMLCFFMTREG